MIREVHQEYVKAGAEILETNTFGANRTRLSAFGLAEKLKSINHGGGRLARGRGGGLYRTRLAAFRLASGFPPGFPPGFQGEAGIAAGSGTFRDRGRDMGLDRSRDRSRNGGGAPHFPTGPGCWLRNHGLRN